MKRSSKLLAALLTLCLLIGAFVTVSSAFDKSFAESIAAGQLTPSGAANYTLTGLTCGSYSTGNSRAELNAVDAKGNSVIRVYNTGASENSNNDTFFSMGIGDTASTKLGTKHPSLDAGVAKSGYHVIDFDIGTDKYAVKIGYELRTNYTSTTDKTGVTTVVYTYSIQDAYKTYTPEELTEANIKADIAAKALELQDMKDKSDFGHEFLATTVTDASGKHETWAPMYDYDLGFDNMAKYEWSYEDAMATKQIAMISGGRGYIMARTWSEGKTGSADGSYTASVYWWQDSDGSWYVGDGKKNKKVELSGEVGVYDHITVVTKVSGAAEGSNVGRLDSYIFVNGQYAYATSKSDVYTAGYECFRLVINASEKTKNSYSYVLANTTSNYYAVDYTSGTAYGIDDYITSGDYTTKSLTELSDVVYTKNYISPNGFLYVKNGYVATTPVSNALLAAETLASLEDGGEIYTSINIPSLTVPAGVNDFKIFTDGGAVVALSSASVSAGYVLEPTKDGYKGYLDLSDRTVYVEWRDIKGNVITTTPLLHGKAPDASGIVANYYDKETNTIYSATVSGWTWNLDGDVRAITPDMLAAGGKVVMTPTVSGSIAETKNVSFYMGKRYDDTLVVAPVPAVNNTFTAYVGANGTSVINNAKQLLYGADTCVLTSDFVGEKASTGGTASQVLPKNSTLNFDLNGHIFSREGAANTFGNSIFTVDEGGTFNCYSSEPGGMIVMAILRASTANVTCSSGGIVSVKGKIDQATVNIGDILDAKGNTLKACGDNFTYIGGTGVLISGSVDSDGSNGVTKYDAYALLRNNKKITVNLNGGTYYNPYRASYALVITQAPDTVLNANGITFVSAYYSSASLFHDYDNQTYEDKDDVDGDGNKTEKIYYYFATNSTVTVKNSELYAMGAAEDSNGNLYGKTAYSIINRLDPDSTVYFEGCTMIGKLVNSLGGNITFGAGNCIADTAKYNLETNAKLHFASGVYFAKPTTSKLTKNVLHPATKGNWSCFNVTLKDGAVIDGALDTQAEAGYISTAYLNPDIFDFDKFVNIKFEADYTYVTYNETNVPDIMAEVRWTDVAGNHIATTYELVGAEPTIPDSVKSVVGDVVTKNWYVKSFSWSAADSEFIVEEGVNVFSPTPVITPKIKGMKINVTLFEDVRFNLYIPVDELVSGVSVSGAPLSSETTVIGGVEYYVVSAELAANEFDPISATISFTAEGKSLSYPVSLDLLSYATVVADRYACGSDEATLVYEMLSYKNAIACATVSGYAAPASLGAFMDKHETCECALLMPEITEEETSVNYDALISKGVTGVAYSLSLGEIGMAIYVNDGVVIDSVTYADDFGRVATHTVQNGNLTLKNGYYLVSGISAAYIDNIMTISVDGAEGTYCLGKYIANNPTVDVAKSLYKYAQASEDYKYTRESENDKAHYSGMKSVLLIGQSNMVGQNDLSVVDPINDDRLFMQRNDTWVPMIEPLHGGNYGAGIGASFGKAFVETFDVDLGLIPAARGATTLEMWAVGGELYNEAIRKAKIAQESSEIVAFLWHQGEGNARDTEYAEKLQVIFDAMIEELGLDADELVIITGEMYGTRSDAYHMPELIDLGKNYKNYGIALSDGLTTVDPQTHFDAPSMRVFGYRYFDIFYNLITGKHYYFNQDQNYYKLPDEG